MLVLENQMHEATNKKYVTKPRFMVQVGGCLAIMFGIRKLG